MAARAVERQKERERIKKGIMHEVGRLIVFTVHADETGTFEVVDRYMFERIPATVSPVMRMTREMRQQKHFVTYKNGPKLYSTYFFARVEQGNS